MSESGQGAHDLNRIDPSATEAAPPVDVERIAAAVREILAAIMQERRRVASEKAIGAGDEELESLLQEVCRTARVGAATPAPRAQAEPEKEEVPS